MKEAITIDRLSSGAFVANIRFNLDGDFVRACDPSGSFCINDYGDFAPSITNLLVDNDIGASSLFLSTTRGQWREDHWGPLPSALRDLPTPSGTLLRAEFPYVTGDPSCSSSSRSQGIDSYIIDTSLMTNPEQCLQQNMNTKISRIDSETAPFDHISVTFGDRFRFMRSQVAGVFNLALDEDTVMSSPFTLLPSMGTASSSTPSQSLLIAQYFPTESVCTENIDAWVKYMPVTRNPPSERRYIREQNNITERRQLGLSSLISRDWILYSPWHSLSLHLSASPKSTSNKISRDNRNRKRNANTNSNEKSDSHLKDDDMSQPNRNNSGGSDRGVNRGRGLNKARQELFLMLDVSAVLLPDILPSHAHILETLRDTIKSNMNETEINSLGSELHSSSSSSSFSSSSPFSSSFLSSSTATPFATSGVNPSRTNSIVLSREVRDSRGRKIFMAMTVNDKFISTTNISTDTCDRYSFPDSSNSSSTKGHVEGLDGSESSNYCNRGGDDSKCTFDQNIRVTIVELITPFYDILLHTYTYTYKSSDGLHNNITDGIVRYVADLPSFLYTPSGGTDRDCYPRISRTSEWINDPHRESHPCLGSISWSLDLPPGGIISSSYTAVKQILHRAKYPSDASKGLIVPPTFVTLHLQESVCPTTCITASLSPYRLLVSDPVLITMPILDSSMPFNIITLVCTIMSFLLGSIINTLVREKKKVNLK